MRTGHNVANMVLICGLLASLLVFMVLPALYTDIDGLSVELSSAARAAAAALSMWVSNTATTMMLLPGATSVIAFLPDDSNAEGAVEMPFAICLLLGVAYASSIGGMGTIIGTAPNLFVVSFVKEQLGREIGFFEWMRFGVPLVIVFLPLAWLLLTKVLFRLAHINLPDAANYLRNEHAALGKFSRWEVLTLCVFLATIIMWIPRPLLNRIELYGSRQFEGLTDTGIAILAALVLFLLPARLRRCEFLMDWQTAVRLPWGLLILFGGGLALAAALVDTGFSQYLVTRSVGLVCLLVCMVCCADCRCCCGIPDRADQQYGNYSDYGSGIAGRGNRVWFATITAYNSGHFRRQLCIHAPSRDSAKCDRIWLRFGYDRADEQGWFLAQYR